MLFSLVEACILASVVILIAILWSYRYIKNPYARFPSCRLEYWVPYWILTRRPLTIALFQKLLELSKKHEVEGMFIAWLYKPILFVYDEETVKFIVKDSSTISRPSFYKLMEFSLGKGLLTSDGELWNRQRKCINPAFHIKVLKTYVSVMNSNAKALVDKLSRKQNEPITDISHILSKCTLRLVYESSLQVRDSEIKEEKQTSENVRMIADFFIQRIFSPWLYSDFALQFFPYARKVIKSDDTLKRTYRQILECTKESVLSRSTSEVKGEEGESDILDKKPKSFGEIIIENHLKHPTLSMQELVDEISILISAGFHTSAVALMFSFFCLGRNQDMQERLYEEVSTVTNEKVEYRDVQDLIFLDCVIKETLRLYSVIPIFGRRLNRDVQIGKHFIPQNTEVLVFPYVLHRNPNIYPDPEKFNPDRFLDADSKIKPWNYIPFAEGSRSCVGKNYALLSIKIIMVHVLRKFKIVSLDRREDLQFKWSIVLACVNDPCMKFIPRHTLPC